MSFMETIEDRLKDPDRILRLRRAIYQLQRRQFIWSGDRGTTGLYEIVIAGGVLPLIEDYFEVSGMRLHHNTAQQWLGLVADPEFFDVLPDERLTGDETIVLLLLALTWQDGINQGNVESRAVVKTTGEKLMTQLADVLSGENAKVTKNIKPARLREILKDFARRSLIAIGEQDPVTLDIEIDIRPMVTQLAGKDTLERLAAFAAAGTPPTGAVNDDESIEESFEPEDDAEESDAGESGPEDGTESEDAAETKHA